MLAVRESRSGERDVRTFGKDGPSHILRMLPKANIATMITAVFQSLPITLFYIERPVDTELKAAVGLNIVIGREHISAIGPSLSDVYDFQENIDPLPLQIQEKIYVRIIAY